MKHQQDYNTILFQALLSDMDMQALLNLCSDLVGNPMALGNARLTVLYTAGHMPPEVPMATPGMIPPQFSTSQEFIQYNEAAYHSDKPVITPLQFGGYRTLISRLCLDGEVVGYMSILLANKPYDASMDALILSIRRTLENHLRKENIFSSETSTPSERFLLGLISENTNAKTISNADIVTRLGLNKQTSFYLMTFKMSGYENANGPNSVLKEQLLSLTGANMSIFHQESLILLLEKKLRPFLSLTKKQKELLDYMKLYGLCGGISYLCKNVSEITRYYRQSKVALSTALKMGGGHLVSYEDVVIPDFIQTRITPKFKRFEMPELKALVAYDKAHHTKYCQLLSLYVENEKHISLTAKASGLSRGSIYRILERIHQITGINLDKNEQLFSLYFGIKILDAIEETPGQQQ